MKEMEKEGERENEEGREGGEKKNKKKGKESGRTSLSSLADKCQARLVSGSTFIQIPAC